MNKKIFTTLFVLIFLTFTTSIAQASDEPLFVTITTEWCSTCKQLKPVLEELENQYSGQVNFLTLNPSTKELLEESRQKAEEYGIVEFFEKNKSVAPTVGILCPDGKKVDKVFIGEINIETYEHALDELLSDSNTICSL